MESSQLDGRLARRRRTADDAGAVCDEWKDALGEIPAPPSALSRIADYFRRQPTEVQFTVHRDPELKERQEVDIASPLRLKLDD